MFASQQLIVVRISIDGAAVCVTVAVVVVRQDSIHMEAVEVVSGSSNPHIAAFFPRVAEDSKKIGAHLIPLNS